MFHDKNIAISLTVITFFLRSFPQVTFTISTIRYGFGSSLPSSTAKDFRVHIQIAIIDIEKRVVLER